MPSTHFELHFTVFSLSPNDKDIILSLFASCLKQRFNCDSDLSDVNDTWQLSEGFVAEEGKCVLPNLAKTRYIELLSKSFVLICILQCFLTCTAVCVNAHLCCDWSEKLAFIKICKAFCE